MRGLGEFQSAQMKHRDGRMALLCRHLRSAIDLLEQIASAPMRHDQPQPPPPILPPAPAAPTIPVEKLMFSMKEASAALGIGRTTLWRAISDGKLAAIKLGNRTLIPAEDLRRWIASLPRRPSSSAGK